MIDESENRKHSAGYWCCWAVLALVLYVASAGPVIYVYVKSGEPTWFFYVGMTAYAPLIGICYRCPPAMAAMNGYLDWWQSLAH